MKKNFLVSNLFTKLCFEYNIFMGYNKIEIWLGHCGSERVRYKGSPSLNKGYLFWEKIAKWFFFLSPMNIISAFFENGL